MSTNIPFKNYFVVACLSSVISCVISYSLISNNTTNPIAVLDVQGIAKRAIDKNPHPSEADSKALAQNISAITDTLVEQGYVVIDSAYILKAPKDTYVDNSIIED
jgi:hypothetical protein